MENTYMPAPFKKKPEYCDISIDLLQISAKRRFLIKWALFTLKLGWLKTNAGTDVRPQNNMYLSAPDTPLAKPFTSETFTDSKPPKF